MALTPKGLIESGASSLTSGIKSAVGLSGSNIANKLATPSTTSLRKTTPIIGERWNQLHTYYFSVQKGGEDGGINGLSDAISPNQIDLRLPPTSLNISIPFASVVSATNRGVLEESNGVVFRMITISGTTGIFPDRQVEGKPVAKTGVSAVLEAVFPAATQAFGTLVSAGQSFFNSAKALTGSASSPSPSEVDVNNTGYFQFWKLHNFFIEYAEAKKKTKNKDLRLVFHAPKDNIAYVCTPVSFDLRRDASSPLQYRYNIVLRCWDLADQTGKQDKNFIEDSPKDPLSVRRILNTIRKARRTVQQASNLIRGVQSDINDVLQVINQTVLVFKDLAGVGAEVVDFLPTIKNNADLLIKTNGQQWDQVFRNLDNSNSRFAEFKSSIVGSSVIGASGAAGAVAIGGIAAASIAGAMASRAQAEGEQINSSPSGERAESNAANPDALRLVTKALEDPEISEAIQLGDLSPLPAPVQEQIDAQSEDAKSITSGDVRTLVGKLQEVSDNIAYLTGAMDEEYAKTYGLPAPFETNRKPTEEDILISIDIQEAKTAYLSTLATGEFYKKVAEDPFADANTILPEDAKVPTPTSAFPIVVELGATLDDLANKHLDDPKRAGEIAILNDLRSPYIDEVGFQTPISLATGRTFVVASSKDLFIGQKILIKGTAIASTRRKILDIQAVGGGNYKVTVDGEANLDLYTPLKNPFLTARLPGTVGSGDIILIPSQDSSDTQERNRKTPLLERLSFAEQIFKVDMALDGSGDLAVGPSGDVARSYGYENAIQALRLLLETELGELEHHKNFGIPTQFGQRSTSELVSDIETSVRQSVLRDPRFSNADVKASLESSVLRIRIDAEGIQGTGRIPVEFQVAV